MTNEAEIAARFSQDVAEHKLRVLHDEGLYRHLMCRSGDSFMYWFEIITSPGQLTIRGDMGTYVFARLNDMFEFFGSKFQINAQYWGEKLQASSGPIKRYSPQIAIQHAKESLTDMLEYRDLDEKRAKQIKTAFSEEVLSQAGSEDIFRNALYGFESFGIHLEDTWEWDLTEYDSHYLWNLYAIVWAIGRYRAQQVAAPALVSTSA